MHSFIKIHQKKVQKYLILKNNKNAGKLIKFLRTSAKYVWLYNTMLQ